MEGVLCITEPNAWLLFIISSLIGGRWISSSGSLSQLDKCCDADKKPAYTVGIACSSTTDSQVPLELVEIPSLVGSGRYIITEFRAGWEQKKKTRQKQKPPVNAENC